MSATVIASQTTNAAVVEHVGAMSKGHASLSTNVEIVKSEFFASVEAKLPVKEIILFLLINKGMIRNNSSVSPELDIATIMSSSCTAPRSPCTASAG